MDHLKYPIGKWIKPTVFSVADVQQWIKTIEEFPQNLGATVEKLNSSQLKFSYREGGWTGAQVIHHLADSHINGYIRFKLGMTELCPTIKPYLEKKWANLDDAQSINIFNSMAIIKGVHSRWGHLLSKMSSHDFDREIVHPEMEGKQKLFQYLSTYAWHSNHHLGHLKIILEQR